MWGGRLGVGREGLGVGREGREAGCGEAHFGEGLCATSEELERLLRPRPDMSGAISTSIKSI